MKITTDTDGTPLMEIPTPPRVEDDDFGNLVVDLVGTPDEYEAEFEYNYETGKWETLYEVEGHPSKEN